MKKSYNDKGISLIEVLIVVVIIGVMTGAVTMTFSIVHSRNPSNCISNIDSLLEEVKSEAMSKERPPYLVIYQSSDEAYPGYYAAKTTSLASYTEQPQSDTKIGTNRIKLQITLSDHSVIDIAEKEVFITFDRASGSMKNCSVAVKGTVPVEVSTPEQIAATGGGRESTIRIIAETGKHFIE